MEMGKQNTDADKLEIISLIKKIKIFEPQLGAYIDHFNSNQNDLSIKLSNGILTIKAYYTNFCNPTSNDVFLKELENVAKTFVKTIY